MELLFNGIRVCRVEPDVSCMLEYLTPIHEYSWWAKNCKKRLQRWSQKRKPALKKRVHLKWVEDNLAMQTVHIWVIQSYTARNWAPKCQFVVVEPEWHQNTVPCIANGNILALQEAEGAMSANLAVSMPTPMVDAFKVRDGWHFEHGWVAKETTAAAAATKAIEYEAI